MIGSTDTVSTAAAGSSIAVTALVHTRKGRFFVKAIPAGHDASRQLREATLAPFVLPVGAALVAHLQRDWDILIFEALDGRPANYAPGSDDLPAVTELLTRVARVPCPSTVDLYEAPLRLQQWINDPDLAYFAGTTLLHTDLAPANVIIADGKARLVGWSAATRGAAWLDPAFWVTHLIAAGHPPAAAEDIVARIPAWQHAPARAVSLFATAQARLPRRAAVGETLRAATRRWLEYRRSLPT
ncbi:hypothetical protein ACQP2F_33275 [Actinoplanes sp. CA-030573]|uniref:hypothetical protein n=1 Tax=Actinoplanes sp. CA-030573 TaxID=3239898 RepID=UPI003D923340